MSRSACILIKKYSYDYSKVKEDRSVFVEMLYNLVTLETLGYACKDLLGTALEYQFITDAGRSASMKRTTFGGRRPKDP